MKRFLIVCSLGLICLNGMAQGKGVFLPAEKAILDLLERDTSSRVVSVLPMKYRFGIRDLAFDRISILKEGTKILLLPDGQDAVFQWRPELGRLIRIDSSRFSGSNFGMMPFIRNGQAWQFGGYGFWRSRDMFTRFDEHSGQWALEYSDSSVTGHLTLYFYDPVADAFYMCGAYRNRPHDMHRTDFKNGVYRYDFRNLSWGYLGQIAFITNPALSIGALHSMNVVYLDSGLIHIMASQTTLFDFKNNIHSRIRLGSDTAFLRVAALSGRFDKAWEHSFMIGDTLMIIHANEHDVSINKLFLKPEMFEPTGQIWSVNADPDASLSITGIFAWLMFGLLLMGGGWYFISRKSNRLKTLFRFNMVQMQREPAHHDVGDWSAFWKGLRPAHQVLLRYLAVQEDSQKGVAADDINHILGLSRRPADLQKVHRNRAIHSINQVYRQTFRTESMLIDRLKDHNDRRQTRLYISNDKLDQIRQHLK